MINWEMRGGSVALITADRHERRNALDAEHCDALAEAVGKAVGSGARALVITGAGTSFCAGADLGGVYGGSFRRSLYGMLHAVTGAPVPVIAAVNGPAVGAGTQLAIACDLRVAAPGAWFAVPTARHGLAVDPWTVRRLALLAGGGAARALLLGGDRLDAELGCQRGLVDRIGGLDDALAWAGEIASFAPESLAYSKRALEMLQEPRPWDPALDEAYEAVWRNRGQG
jgi:enoyl-CoA hydratase